MRPDTIALQRTVLGRSWTMRNFLGSLVAAAALILVGCSLDLANPNSPTPGQALKDPRTATGQMIVGVLATYRDNRANQIRALGSYGRETYYMFLTDGRFIDRKSTRLNSSHSQISYAVFCLKKKKYRSQRHFHAFPARNACSLRDDDAYSRTVCPSSAC